MLNGLLVAGVSEPSVTVMVYPLAAVLTEHPVNVTTPSDSVLVHVLESNPVVPCGEFSCGRTDEESAVTTRPFASSTVTTGCGTKLVPPNVVAGGCVVKTSLLAGPATLNGLGVVPARLVDATTAFRLNAPPPPAPESEI